MKYAVVVLKEQERPRVFVANGGGFLDMESASEWAQGFVREDAGESYVVVLLEIPG